MADTITYTIPAHNSYDTRTQTSTPVEAREVTRTLLRGHTSPATAYVVEDYPYGFRLRCSIRHWIETTKHGDRFVSQTTNPKRPGIVWNKPKPSIYAGVMCMILDEDGHVSRLAIEENNPSEWIRTFLDAVDVSTLSDAQRARAARIVGYTEAMRNVTFTVRETTGQSAAEHEADEQSERITYGHLDRIIAHKAAQTAAGWQANTP